jgi:transcriptional regulator with XRE-family HTH domain
MTTTKTTAQLVDDLFKEHRKPDGQEYSYQEVSKALEGELDASYIAKVRRGVIKNPGRDALMLLCRFFRVPASYFFPELDDLALPEETIDKTHMDLIRVGLRSMDFTPEVQDYLEGIITALRDQRNARE